MKGLLFTSFLHLVETEYGLEMVDEVIADAAPKSGGIYTTVGNYDHNELIAMIAVLSKKINVSLVHLTKAFGMYLFTKLIAAYPSESMVCIPLSCCCVRSIVLFIVRWKNFNRMRRRHLSALTIRCSG